MKLLITVIVVFLIIVYGYTYIRYKKRRKQMITDHVKEFHDKYQKSGLHQCTNSSNDTQAVNANAFQPIDFMDKDALAATDSRTETEVSKTAKTNRPGTSKKKLQF